MITLTNYGSGEIAIKASGLAPLRLPRDKSNRLVMAARMTSIAEFLEKLPNLIASKELCAVIASAFDGKDHSTRWGLKEKFARLSTLAKGYTPESPGAIIETVSF